MDLEYSWLKKKVKAIAGIDLDSYRPDQMKRLLDKAVEKSGSKNFVQFIKDLEDNPDKVQGFRDSITINVSSLFRDAARWNDFEAVLRDYVRAKSDDIKNGKNSAKATLRIWSAGCSIGAEAYTLAVLAEKISSDNDFPELNYHIMCTDIDNTMLVRGRHGVFSDKETKEVPAQLLEKYFEEVPNPGESWSEMSTAKKYYRALPQLRSKMVFRNHNLLEEAWEGNYDVIVCRNVLIYFTNEIKEKLFNRFSSALRERGILFIGGTEVIFKPGDYGLSNEKAGIYRKNSRTGGAGVNESDNIRGH